MAEVEMEGDHEVLERAGVAFDPTTQHLELSPVEKRRTTALLMAIQAYRELIIKDADYLREAHAIARQENREIQPARIDEMVTAALKFDFFIATGMAARDDQIVGVKPDDDADLDVIFGPEPAPELEGEG